MAFYNKTVEKSRSFFQRHKTFQMGKILGQRTILTFEFLVTNVSGVLMRLTYSSRFLQHFASLLRQVGLIEVLSHLTIRIANCWKSESKILGVLELLLQSSYKFMWQYFNSEKKLIVLLGVLQFLLLISLEADTTIHNW